MVLIPEKFAATFLISNLTQKLLLCWTKRKQVLLKSTVKVKSLKVLKLRLVDGDDKDYQGYQDHYSIKSQQKNVPL